MQERDTLARWKNTEDSLGLGHIGDGSWVLHEADARSYFDEMCFLVANEDGLVVLNGSNTDTTLGIWN